MLTTSFKHVTIIKFRSRMICDISLESSLNIEFNKFFVIFSPICISYFIT